MAQCEATTTSGTRCRAQALAGRSCCFAHDPDRAEERRRERSAGGRARSKPRATLPPDTPDMPLGSVAAVATLLGVTINQCRRGELDPRVSNSIGLLANALVNALKVGTLEERLAAVEQKLAAGTGRLAS